jgi:tetratricopeptide (TPR) repeat protein
LLPHAPNSYEVHELLGLTYAAEKRDERAVGQLQAAAKLRPDDPAARTNLATALTHAGKLDEAAEQFRRALALEPDDYDANHDLAECYLQQKKIVDALPPLAAAQRLRPAAYDNGYDLALADLLTAKRGEARTVIEALLPTNNTGELHNLLGQIDEKDGKYVEAAHEYETAAHLDPSEDNLFVWGSELLLHRTYEPAIAVFRQAAKRYPGSPRLWIGLGMALYSRGQYEESIRSLLTASDLDPRDPRCYLFLSKAYLSSPQQADEVIARFRRYAELEPDSAMAQYYYAVGLWKGKRVEDPTVDYAAVEALLRKSIALDGTIADAHLQLGILYTDQREYAKSYPEYARALELDPNLPDAHYRLGQYYVHAGEKEKAQREFDVYQKLQAAHQAEVDKERAEVRQFIVAAKPAAPAKP